MFSIQQHGKAQILALFCLMALCGGAMAASTLSYQGVLRDASGVAVPDNTYAMEFTLWDAETIGNQLWAESHAGVLVKGGAFSVVLGGSTSLGTIFTDHSAVWLQVAVNTGGGLEIYAPRVPMTAAPYAQQAQNADTLDGVDSTGFLTSAHNTNASAHANINLDGARITSGKINNLRLNTGPGLGLDADTVDGKQASELDDSLLIESRISQHNGLATAHGNITLDGARITTGKIDNARLNTGSGAGLDADLLDGVHAAALEESAEITSAISTHNNTAGAHTNLALNANQITSGKLDNMRLNTGSGGGIDSDMLDGSHASAFATSGHGHDLQDLGGAVTDDQVPNSITVDYAAQAGTATSATNAGNANTVGGYTAAQLATQMDTKISTHNTEVTAHNDLRSQIAANTPPGTIVQYAGATAPTGWLICNGTSVSTTTYAALYAVIGYTYGGSGSTFSLPNLVGKVAVGKSISSPFDTLGNTGGEITHLLTAAEMPSHTHTQNQHGHAIHNGYGGPNGIGASAESGSDDNNWSFQDRMFASQFAFVADYTTATNQNTGGGQAHNNLQPYLVLNYIIKY